MGKEMERLEIQVNARTTGANKQLDMLAAKVRKVANSFNNIKLSNLQSSLLEQTGALNKYSTDIANAALQTYAYKDGLSTAVLEMKQADKMQLLLLAILNQLRSAWENQANAIGSLADQYRLYKQQISNVASMISSLFMPAIQTALPVINGMLIAVQRLLGSIGRLSGVNLGGIEIGSIDDGVNDAAYASSINKAQQYADKICNVFNTTWSSIKAGDFAGLGEYIAGGVDFVFEKINSVFNWEKMGPPITGFVNSYCQTINSLVTNINWESIGQTIGDGLNVITNTLYLSLTEIDWLTMGTAIATGLNSMVNSIDWNILGQTIGACIMQIPQIIYGFVSTLDFSALGTGIGNALNGALMEFDGKTVAGGINGIVNGILETLKAFIKTVDWGEVAKAVGDVLGNLDWGTLAEIGLAIGAFKLTSGFGSILKTALSETLVKMIGGGLEDTIKGIGPQLEIFKGNLGTDLGRALKGISELLGGTSFGATIGIVVGGIVLVISGLVDLWNTSETFRDNVKNMWDIICAVLADAKVRIWDEGLKPLWDSIKELFASLYQLYEESGLKDIFEVVITGIGYILSFCLAGLIEGIAGFVQFITNGIQIIVEIITLIVDAVIWLKDKIIEAWDWIMQKFQAFQEFLGNVFATDWSEKFGVFGEVLNNFFDSAKEIIDSIKRVFSGIIDFVAGVFTGDWDRAWKGIKDIFGGIWDGFVAIVKAPINGIISILNLFLKGVQSMANSIAKALSFKIDLPEAVEKILGISSFGINIPKIKIPKIPYLANGGILNTGEAFIARERGPELVGRFGNKTGVMNNDQLVDSVSSSLRQNFRDVAMEVAAGVAMTMHNGRQSTDVNVILQGDTGQIFKVVQKEAQKYERNYMKPAFG